MADALSGVPAEGILARFEFRVRPGGGTGSLRVTDGLLLEGSGLTRRVVGSGLSGGQVPLSYSVGRNYPNQFNPMTQIAYQVPEAGRVRLVVYNILGQRVRTLADGLVSAGFHSVAWDGRDDSGRPVSSGIYLYRMEATGFSGVRKMLLVK